MALSGTVSALPAPYLVEQLEETETCDLGASGDHGVAERPQPLAPEGGYPGGDEARRLPRLLGPSTGRGPTSSVQPTGKPISGSTQAGLRSPIETDVGTTRPR
jgi:hypothetical protein